MLRSKMISTLRISILHYDLEKLCFLPSPVVFTTSQQSQMMEIHNMPGIRMPSDSWIHDYEIWRSWKYHSSYRQGVEQEKENKADDDDDDNSINEPFLMEDDTNGVSLGQLPPIFDTVRDLHEFNHVGRSLVERLREEYLVVNNNNNITVADYVDLYCNLHIDAGVGLWHIQDVAYGCIVPIHHLPVSDSLKTKLRTWKRANQRAKHDVTTKLMDQSQITDDDECHDLEEHILWELNVHAIPSLDDLENDESGRSENSRATWTMCWKQPPTPKHANQQNEVFFAFDSPLIEKAHIKRRVL